MSDVHTRIQQMVDNSPVFLFMKGTPEVPQCGFSMRAVQVLNHLGVNFQSFNVLADPEVRQGVKSFANWPTIPQLYVKGSFVGGCDIMVELFENGELQELVSATH